MNKEKNHLIKLKMIFDSVNNLIDESTGFSSDEIYSHTGTFVKIDDKLREIFRKSGLPTYRKGGIVNAIQSL